MTSRERLLKWREVAERGGHGWLAEIAPQIVREIEREIAQGDSKCPRK